jgi:NAD(P)-dependent dehydrogenase (short-subunit alcohol dehydrogenase family)
MHPISEAIRRELHGERIRVMIVSPGWTNTELGQNMQNEEIRDRLQEDWTTDRARSPIARHQTLHELAIMSIEEGWEGPATLRRGAGTKQTTSPNYSTCWF